MDPWLDRLADVLQVPRLDPADVDAVLDLARVVAHGTERRNAPLAAYLVGRWVDANDETPAVALDVARRLLPEEGGTPPSRASR